MLAILLDDLRYAVRGFARRPLFAVVVVLTLAVGIGVNVAMFSIFEQVLLRPLPAPEPDRLVNLSSPSLGKGSSNCNNAGDCDSVFSYPMFRDLERSDGPFTGIAAHRYFDANIAYNGQSYAGYAMLVSGSYFPVLGLSPALGRLLGPNDDAVEDEATVVVLSYDYWRSALGADPDVLGKTLVVNGKLLTIVGVAPERFHGTTVGGHAHVYVPITFRWRTNPNVDPSDNRARRWVYLFARLKPGLEIERAAAGINPTYRAILSDIEAPLLKDFSEQDLAAFRTKTIRLEPGARGQSAVRGMARMPLTVLIVATSLVLLIACLNVANLMLVRGSGRAGELAVRTSLGATPMRIAGLLTVEAALLAALAAIASVPLTAAALGGIEAFVPAWAADLFAVRLDSHMLLVTAAFGVASAALFGVWPAIKLARRQPGNVLRAEGTRTTSSKAAARFRAALTTSQVGLSMTLLVLAGWFAQSLVNASRVDLGIRPDSLVTFEVAPERNGYAPSRAAELFDRLARELGALPGVTSVASATVGLLQSTNWDSNVAVEGSDLPPGADANVSTNYVSPGFFSTLKIPLVAGRGFTEADSRDRAKVAIVNERFLAKFGLDRDVVGKHMSFGQGGPLDVEIVGIARDAKYSEVKKPTPPQVFAPRAQPLATSSLSFYVRGGLDPLALRKGVEQVLAAIAPGLPLVEFRTMQDVVHENLFVDRFMSVLAVVLAGLATLLASLGLYGVLSYGVAERTREIGLRLALGAPPGRLTAMVLKQVAWIAAIGGVLGLAAALLIGRAARSLLFELSPTDPAILSIAVITLGAVVVAAGYLPARRAARIDPVVALRAE
jgi:putative ABC transport system permease protein